MIVVIVVGIVAFVCGAVGMAVAAAETETERREREQWD